MIDERQPTLQARRIKTQNFAIQEWRNKNELIMVHLQGILNPSDGMTKPFSESHCCCRASVNQSIQHWCSMWTMLHQQLVFTNTMRPDSKTALEPVLLDLDHPSRSEHDPVIPDLLDPMQPRSTG
jgi:hypothetical protein